jgi:cytochrome oxidase Cu insertion factor (SCO1/SenC/PrrC family)
MTRPWAGRPGAASLALLLILVITAAWWALALWPAGAVEPAWLMRTRAACFGSAPGGLPDAGGWILLIGEPIGMLGVLMAVWGGALRDDLRRMRTDPRWRFVMVGVGAVSLVGLAAFGQRVAFAAGLGAPPSASPSGTPSPVDIDVSAFILTDQQGRRTSLAGFQGGPVLLTFAFGHCTTVCPTILHDLLIARAAANRPEVPLLVISLDPWRDTPARLPSLASAWALGPEDRVFSGSVDEVERTLDALGVGRRRDGTTGNIDHAGTVMALDDRGHIVWRVDGGWGRVKELLAAMPPSGNRSRGREP